MEEGSVRAAAGGFRTCGGFGSDRAELTERASGAKGWGSEHGHRVSKKVRTVGHPAERTARIERGHPHLSVRWHCELLGVDRGEVYHSAQGLSEKDLALMRWMDEGGRCVVETCCS